MKHVVFMIGLLVLGGCTHFFDTDELDFASSKIYWVEIPSGTFLMGNTYGLPDASDAEPVHAVSVDDFEMARTETTVAQYSACIRDGACDEPDSSSWVLSLDLDIGSLPANGVNWFQAVDFCAWAGGRLPTEAEWEYAARNAGEEVLYPWGDEDVTCEWAIICDYTVSAEDQFGCGTSFPWPVCSRPTGNTEQGLCDMSGNVREFVQDTYHWTYDGAPNDGSSWESSDWYEDERVVRGGSFYTDDEDTLTVFSRDFQSEETHDRKSGFRCAR